MSCGCILNYIVLPATGLLFYGISFLLEKSKKNFFIGIRIPWTLSSDEVWRKTHKLGAKMFRVFAILAFVSVIIPSGFMVFMASTFLGVIYLFAYSYFEYKKEKKN
ncbi:MAG: SdpI family protein [Candidatus Aenigmarchaeota archaeon]|nr:SdpI family protein [Candidatus Aenigmarchaeota archaeon]